MAVEYPELSTMPARTKRSSAKCTPPLLRNCTGALWPRKKTRSGKIFGEMSAALRTTSLPAAGGLSALTAWRCRRGKFRSTSGRKMKNLLNRIMETPLRMRESYNIQFRSGKKKRRPSALLWLAAFSGEKSRETVNDVVCYLTRAPAGLHKGEDKDAGSAKFYEGVFGNGSGRDTAAGSVVGASTSAGCRENHQRDDRQCRLHRGRGHRGRLQANDARELERACQGLRRNLQAAHTEFRRARADF